MPQDKLVRCPPNANAPRGAVKDLICDPSCPHYPQSRNLDGTFSPNRRVRRAIQDMARSGGRFRNCPNRWL